MTGARKASATPGEAGLLRFAKGGDQRAFHQLTEPHRRELHLHCYRMLGSFHDAEDALQETYLRAWRGLQGFEGRASVRQWLYRIATNACLSALSARGRTGRVLPETHGPPADGLPGREPASEVPWLEPYPGSALEGIVDRSPRPDARYELREAVQLAFIAAIQLLPPRQRAVLLLQDVLGWSAAETARLLDCSTAAVNSGLQRARATLEERLILRPPSIPALTGGQERALLERYIRAWETSDVGCFAALLREDAVMSMPPWIQWYRGRTAIVAFFAATGRPGGHAPFRLLPTAANGQTAFAFYSRWQSPEWRFHSIQVLQFDRGTISRMTSFVMPALASVFGLPPVLPAAGGDTPTKPTW